MDDRPFSPTQVIVGLVGLAIAVWGLAGGPDIVALRWAAIGIVVVIGVVLIVVGGLRGRHR